MKKTYMILWIIFVSVLLIGCDQSNNSTTTTQAVTATTETTFSTESTTGVVITETTNTTVNQTTTGITTTNNTETTTSVSSTETTIQVFTVTFDSMGGTTVSSQEVTNGSVLIEPSVTREGYQFLGWFESIDQGQTLSNQWVFETNVVYSNMTLYAKWIALEELVYTISYEFTGDSYFESITQTKGSLVNQPNNPIKNGFLFDGWYEDSEFTTPFDFSLSRNTDVTLYAKWIEDPNMVKITFETYGGSEMDVIYTLPNEPVIIPKTSLRAGYVFLNWCWDTDFTKIVYSPIYITEDTTLYANWYEQPNVVYIFFDSKGGTPVDPYQKRPGQAISSPNEPTRPGYDFIGWYQDEDYTRRFYFTSMGSETITLYARWQKIEVQNDEIINSVESVLGEWGFTCIEHVCTYGISTGYNYMFDFNTNDFAYIKQTVEENELGYRNYYSVIIFDAHWNVNYTYDVEEDFGYEFHTTLILSGNYETGNYEINQFESNIQSEQARYDDAISSIEYFANFLKSVLENANIILEDLN